MDNLRVGTRLGPYQINRLVGRGGMGEVYEAEDTVKGRTVALKLLPESLSHDPAFRERLQREARAAGRLQEPHVVPIHDFGEIDGHLFVDMRLIDGIDLRTVLHTGGPMEPARAVSIIRQVAGALDAAHAAGITHRDVKPENILVTSDDFAYLVDFGIASATTDHSLTELGAAIGTYAYMAPERFSSKPVDHKSDVYSLACVLHQCLTAAQPYVAQSISMMITAHLIDPPPRPSQMRPGVPPAFDDVVATGMAKTAEERYDSAGALARAAESALGVRYEPTARVLLPTEQAPPPAAPARDRRRPLLIAGGIATAVLLAGGAVGAWLALRSPDSASAMSSTLTLTRTVTNAPRLPLSTTSAFTPAERQLMEMLPDPAACTPNRKWDNAIAAFDCKPTESGDGHEGATFALYSDVDRLKDDFTSVTGDDELTACPGTDGSPTNWDYNSGDPDASEGLLACGDFQGRADIVWTKTSDLILGTGQGNNLDDLYKWWVGVA
ncbi:serine/threonine-protein kinase [Mycobacterium sp. 236(2023)]|uniref:serine/threonine-protein kinase n=1 Tax=Mycobacterium sp. 236(2023) TaxID=3038163 RepID=UPI002415078A|nr:serine/threonine-protein kinase [Mycobacterium sp. 236(2023)]MDG4667579.1 serine/threonine-protein kinase [Mycobacterium sp. 236(2023)]